MTHRPTKVRDFIKDNFLFREDRASSSDTKSLLEAGLIDSDRRAGTGRLPGTEFGIRRRRRDRAGQSRFGRGDRRLRGPQARKADESGAQSPERSDCMRVEQFLRRQRRAVSRQDRADRRQRAPDLQRPRRMRSTASRRSSLRRGVARGDRVVIFMDNSWKAVVALFAVLKAGAVFSLINPSTKAGKLA